MSIRPNVAATTAPTTAPVSVWDNSLLIALRHDIRVFVILVIEKHSLKLSTFFTAVLAGLAALSITLEYKSSCDENIKLWLAGTALRAILCTSIKLYAAAISAGYILYQGNPQLLQKFVEMLDVFGVVWFCIGNLLVFNDSSCKSQNPLVFYVSMSYIVVVYVLMFCNLSVRISLAIWPTSIDVRLMLDDFHVRNDTPSNRFGGRSYGFTSPVTDWKSWLASHGCIERSYPDWQIWRKTVVTATSNQANATTEDSGSCNLYAQAGSTIMTTCPICLSDFSDRSSYGGLVQIDTESQIANPIGGDDAGATGRPESVVVGAGASSTAVPSGHDGNSNTNSNSNNNVVEFPCAGRHLFHATCLHHWLSVGGFRRNEQRYVPTCPVCRDTVPIVPATPTPTTPGGNIESPTFSMEVDRENR